MYSCAIFGHSDYSYEKYINKIEQGLRNLIEMYQVTEFYVGMRGRFDTVCVQILKELQKKYTQIKLIRVWAYIPQENKKVMEENFDGTVYLLERKVPPTYAIIETNKNLVKKVDYIFSGITHEWGGAWMAVEYAKKKGKRIMDALGEG